MKTPPTAETAATPNHPTAESTITPNHPTLRTLLTHRLSTLQTQNPSPRIALAGPLPPTSIPPLLTQRMCIMFQDAETAHEAVVKGEADILMKGSCRTDQVMHAVVVRPRPLVLPGHTLHHLALVSNPFPCAGKGTPLLITDPAILPQPGLEEMRNQVCNAAKILQQLGLQPRIALLHCSEKTDERHFPYTGYYAQLKEEFSEDIIIDGPLDFQTALDAAAAEHKGIVSPLHTPSKDGHPTGANAFICPDITSANLLYKTCIMLGSETANVLCGTKVPVVISSRNDTPQSKELSLIMAMIQYYDSTFISE